MKSFSVVLSLTICVLAYGVGAETIAERFDAAHEKAKVLVADRQARYVQEQKELLREAYQEFTVAQVFNLARARMAEASTEPAPGYRYPDYDLGNLFLGLPYVQANDRWAEVFAQLRMTSHEAYVTPFMLVQIGRIELIGDQVPPFFKQLQAFYQDQSLSDEIRAAAIQQAHSRLAQEFERIWKQDPVVARGLEERRMWPQPERGASISDLLPETQAALVDIEALVSGFVREMIALYAAVEDEQLKETIKHAVELGRGVPNSALEETLAFKEACIKASEEQRRAKERERLRRAEAGLPPVEKEDSVQEATDNNQTEPVNQNTQPGSPLHDRNQPSAIESSLERVNQASQRADEGLIELAERLREDSDALVRGVYTQFTVAELFEVVRLKHSDAIAKQTEVRSGMVLYMLYGHVFNVMPYAKSENYWRDIFSELHNPSNDVNLRQFIYSWIELQDLPGEEVPALVEVAQRLYRNEDTPIEVRAASIEATRTHLDSEFSRIYHTDPEVHAYYEEHHRSPLFGDGDSHVEITPETRAALNEIDMQLGAFVREMIALFNETDDEVLSRCATRGVYFSVGVPHCALSEALAFKAEREKEWEVKREEKRQAEAEAFRQKAIREGLTVMEGGNFRRSLDEYYKKPE